MDNCVRDTRIAVLMTCHNRKTTTLRCLGGLFTQECLEGIALQVYLVDDGCIDGTADAVRSVHPGVHVIAGTGNLFWSGGMRVAWREALKEDYDYYLWLNDDVELFSDAIMKLLVTSRFAKKHDKKYAIICGSTYDKDTRINNYGGRVRPKWWQPLTFELLEPGDEPRRCVTMNGQIVLVPKTVVEKIGILSSVYTQGAGDYDYGLRARRRGIFCWVAPGHIGTCPSNPPPSHTNPALPIEERLRRLKKATEHLPPKQNLTYVWRHAGIFWPIYWARTTLRIIFPRLYLIWKSQTQEKDG